MTDSGISDEATAEMDGKKSSDEWERETNREMDHRRYRRYLKEKTSNLKNMGYISFPAFETEKKA